MSRKILTGVLDSISRGYTISSSALFDRWTTASPGYMTRTFGTPTAQNIFTVSTWVKRGVSQTVNGDSATNSGAAYDIMDCGGTGFNNQIWFYDTLNMYGGEFFFTTKALFMDTAAWYHIVIACNANLSGTNKIKVYVNGSEVTDFDTDLRQNFPGTSGKWNNAVLHSIGGGAPQSNFFDGYMADTYFIDGQALDANYFGQFSSTTGAWIPKKYSGSYGNNGFYLDYSNSSNLGADYSGRNNNFTKNGDIYKTTDGPQPSSINSSLGNYAVWNTQTPYYSIAYKGNTRVSCTSGSSLPSTIFVNSGKWYWEVKWAGGTNPRIGVCSEAGIGQDLGGTANTWCRLNSPSRIYNNGTTTSFGTDLTLNDIIMIAMDVDAGKIWYGKNGSWEGSGNPSAGTNAAQTFTPNLSMSPAVSSGGGTPVFEANFGSFGFAYTAPTNFKALNTSNITNPSVLLPNRYYDAVQYAGTSNASTAVGGLNFSPDLVWIKNKSLYVDGQSNNMLFDVLRGATNYLNTDKTNTQQTLSTSLTSFNQNGFTPGTATRTNETNSNYIAWNWDAGSSTLTNTDGTVTSTVRVNQTAGFSIVQYNTGNNLNAYTVGHGLGKAPKFIMIKGGYTTDNYNWDIYHTSLGPTKRLKINSTDGPETQGGPWDNTAPSSTLIYQNNQNNFWYGTNRNNIAYCWTDIDGYSKFGSYTGTSSANGPFVHLGFKPAWLLIKRTDTGGDYWNLMDSKRDTYNEGGSNTDRMYPNSINSNETGIRIDFLSNGFKIRDTNSNNNGTNMTYVYAAFAENPFKYSVAR